LKKPCRDYFLKTLTKLSKTFKMKTIRFFLIPGLIILIAMKADNPFIANLINKIGTYADNYAPERVYVQTDKTIYNTSDDIWFRAYVFNALEKKLSLLSHSLYFKLFGPNGNELLSGKFYIQKGLCDGDIKIPSNWEEGRYLLICYSSWMKNQPVDQIFQKEIYIKKDDFISVRITTDSIYQLLKIGKPAILNGQLISANGNALPSQQMNYVISTRGKSFGKGKFTTDSNGNFNIKVKFESLDFKGNLLLEVEGNQGKEMLFGVSALPWLIPPVSISFSPEGGNLLDGELNIIAVCARDSKGNIFPFKAIINDSKGKTQADINTGKKKWGKTVLKAIAGEKYCAKIIRPLDINDAFFLPEVKNSGIALHLISSNSNFVLLRTAAAHMNVPRMYMAARWGQGIFWAANLNLMQERNISIPTGNLPAGIADIFLIDSTGNMQAMRPTFINSDQQTSLFSKTERNIYSPREKVVVELSLKNQKNQPLDGILSASVSQAQIPISGNELPASFYIQSSFSGMHDIASFANTNGYYFSEPEYTFFSGRSNTINWSTLLAPPLDSPPAYISKEGISGLVLQNSNKPAPNALIALVNNSNNDIQQVSCNERGEFNFDPFTPSATKQEFNLFATTADKKEKLNIHIDDKYEKALSEYLLSLGYNMPARNSDISNSMKMADKRTQYQKYYSPNRSLIEILQQMKYFNITGNQIIFTGMMNSINNQQGALIVIDGNKEGTDVSALNSVNTAEIRDVNIYTNVSDILRYTALNVMGVIDISLKKGKEQEYENVISSKVFNLVGFNLAGTFGTSGNPNNDVKLLTRNDGRTTLLWQPEIKLNKDGQTTIEFYTSDKKGRFIGVIQGIAGNGSPVYGSFEFDVK
jgi:hypothetical protein